ncbi:regulator of microtubule dynamics protein 3-like [Scyliorhinus canicula]|uniref:regulator of microtubule dynamics protein 3-like n=1 Tax=Scyliorhinus canicula TaxID=7830 RepID=UPI0018F34BF7|nr:regulator of microtubule dynamics protein 3-like [Scyliorhinus canicula]
MSSQEKFKALGLVAGAAAGLASGFLGVYYLWRHQKSRLLLQGLQPLAQSQAGTQTPTQAAAASGPTEEQLEIRWHLDSIQGCLDGLKAEVSSLKECIQSIVEKQAGLRKPKSSRKKKRRYESKRDSDDSAESVSIYFTANAGKASDSESEAGQIEIPEALDCSMLAFAAESFTEDRTGLDAESPFLQYQPTAGYAAACTDTEVEKDEEQDSDLVQVLDFSPALEPETETGSVQCLISPEPDQSEMSALLEEVDRLHVGSKVEQEQGFKVLLDNKNKYGKRREFCWRMIRAYSDMTELTEDKETQKCYALAGRDEATASLQDHGDSIECQIWLAVVCRHLQDHDVEDRSEENNSLKETRAEADVPIEDVNSYESLDSDPANISVTSTSQVTEATENNEEQDVQAQHEGNILVDAINSYDSIYTQHYAMSITDIAAMEDRNKEEDMQAIDEANLMVEFIDGYRMTYTNECNVSVSDTAQRADTESESDQQDEAGEDKDLQDWRGEAPDEPTKD